MKKAAPNAKILFVSPDNDNYISSIENTTNQLGKIFDKKQKAKSLNKQLKDKVKETHLIISNRYKTDSSFWSAVYNSIIDQMLYK